MQKIYINSDFKKIYMYINSEKNKIIYRRQKFFFGQGELSNPEGIKKTN